jgi:hypothetical protein
MGCQHGKDGTSACHRPLAWVYQAKKEEEEQINVVVLFVNEN